MKKTMRQIVIDGKVYLWRFTPGYVKIDDSPGYWECQDRFLAYLQSARNSQLHVHFRTWEDPTRFVVKGISLILGFTRARPIVLLSLL